MTTHPDSITTTTSRHRRWRRYASAVLALTTLSGVHTAANATTASAAGWASGTLTIRRGHDPYHADLTVIGTFEMSQEEARAVLAGRPSLQLRYMGDDPAWDDLLYVKYIGANTGQPTYLSLTDKGLFLYSRVEVDSSLLNEDPEGRDEVYASVRLSASGRGVAKFNTFPVYGYF